MPKLLVNFHTIFFLHLVSTIGINFLPFVCSISLTRLGILHLLIEIIGRITSRRVVTSSVILIHSLWLLHSNQASANHSISLSLLTIIWDKRHRLRKAVERVRSKIRSLLVYWSKCLVIQMISLALEKHILTRFIIFVLLKAKAVLSWLFLVWIVLLI